MAFFDNLTKKVSEATQTVAQKGRDLADITKLNIAISDEEKKIDELYKEIGKLFVERIGDSVDGEFADKVSSIKAAQVKIAECKQQIKNIKGVMVCSKCGAELPADAVFCNACGEKQANDAAEKTVVCEKCGATLPKEAVFCTSCGEKVNKTEE